MSALPAPGLKRSVLNCGCTGTAVCACATAEAANDAASTAFRTSTSATARRCAVRRRQARHSPTSARASKGAKPPPPPDPQPPEPATSQTPGVPLGWHWPATHDALVAHCASLLHVAAHTAPEHPPAPQASCTLAGQLPDPLHIAGSVITPAEHDPARHSTVAPGYAHCVASLPSQAPPQAVPSEAHACRDPWGAPTALAQLPTWPGTSHAWHCPPQAVPSEAHGCRAPCGAPITFVQAPAEPGTSQAWHWPLQAVAQHTPSTHSPLAHWFAPPQATPGPLCGVQRPAAQ